MLPLRPLFFQSYMFSTCFLSPCRFHMPGKRARRSSHDLAADDSFEVEKILDKAVSSNGEVMYQVMCAPPPECFPLSPSCSGSMERISQGGSDMAEPGRPPRM